MIKCFQLSPFFILNVGLMYQAVRYSLQSSVITNSPHVSQCLSYWCVGPGRCLRGCCLAGLRPVVLVGEEPSSSPGEPLAPLAPHCPGTPCPARHPSLAPGASGGGRALACAVGEVAVPKGHRARDELTAPCSPSAPRPAVRVMHKDPYHFLRCVSAVQYHVSLLEKCISLSYFPSHVPAVCFCVSYLASVWPKICSEGLSC